MKSAIKIRKARPEDLEQMLGLWRELMNFHRQLDPLFKRRAGATQAWLKFVRDNMDKDNALVLVADKNGVIVGHTQALITPYPPVFRTTQFGELMELVVHAHYRRQGIGQKLVKHIKRWYKHKNITRIEVRAHMRNMLSTSFYRKMGFEPYLETLVYKD